MRSLLIIFPLFFILFLLGNQNLYSKEYSGEGRRVYKAFIKKSIIAPGPNTDKGAYNYFLVDKNDKEIRAKWDSENDPVPIVVTFYLGSPEISVPQKTRQCLEDAAKSHYEVEISGNWQYYGEGTEGFDEATVQCGKIPSKDISGDIYGSWVNVSDLARKDTNIAHRTFINIDRDNTGTSITYEDGNLCRGSVLIKELSSANVALYLGEKKCDNGFTYIESTITCKRENDALDCHSIDGKTNWGAIFQKTKIIGH